MQAIQVKVLAPTDTKGSRIKAWSFSGESITLARDYSSELSEDMYRAAVQLAKKLEWKNVFRGGTLPNGDMVWVLGSELCFSTKD